MRNIYSKDRRLQSNICRWSVDQSKTRYNDDSSVPRSVSYWRLVYCMTDTSTNTSIYPGNWKSMNLETVHLDFTNIYGYTYTVVDYTRVLRRISAAFQLIASESVTEYYSSVNKALSKTWCDKINGLGMHWCMIYLAINSVNLIIFTVTVERYTC